jgi:hypothetical protein
MNILDWSRTTSMISFEPTPITDKVSVRMKPKGYMVPALDMARLEIKLREAHARIAELEAEIQCCRQQVNQTLSD